MTRIFTAIAAASLLSALSFAGIAHADSVKTDTGSFESSLNLLAL